MRGDLLTSLIVTRPRFHKHEPFKQIVTAEAGKVIALSMQQDPSYPASSTRNTTSMQNPSVSRRFLQFPWETGEAMLRRGTCMWMTVNSLGWHPNKEGLSLELPRKNVARRAHRPYPSFSSEMVLKRQQGVAFGQGNESCGMRGQRELWLRWR